VFFLFFLFFAFFVFQPSRWRSLTSSASVTSAQSGS
jgi:hypothetical protein